jgi:NTE family protein
MTRALVLGGGGPLGIAWRTGLFEQLRRRGVSMAGADLILGTSAGSVVGAALATGSDLAALAQYVAAPLPVPAGTEIDITGLQALAAQTAATAATPEQATARIGDYALSANTIGEATYIGNPLFAAFSDTSWPAAFRCTGIDARTGQLRVWDASTEPDLPHALAASCAVPGILPPVTIGGSRYIDGGMRSPLNATLAVGHDHVVVVSCFALTLPDGAADPAALAAARGQLAEVDQLHTSAADVTLIEPSRHFLDISGWGADVMDTSRAREAHEAGIRQADETAVEQLSAWHA